MPRAELTLTLPRDIWIGELSRAYPDTRFRILAALPDDESGVGLAEITGDQHEPLLEEMRRRDAVDAVDLLSFQGDTALVQFETSSPLLLFPVQGSGVPLEMPFDLVDGEAVWELTAPRDRLSELGEQLEQFGIPFRVDRIEKHVDADQLLTEKQWELVRTAVSEGYYDTPRECTLTELAEHVDLAKSTCSETLHRAEGEIISQFVAEKE